MKTKEEIEKVLRNLPQDKSITKYRGMTYEEGIEEALLFVLDELIDDEEFPYYKKE